MRNTWLVAVGCDSTAHLTSRPRGWLASILATLCVRVHPLSSCASAWPRETECVRRAECTRAARVAPSTMQIRAVTEKRIQTWMVERRWMVAVENSENALLVENDMRDNKQQRDSRCATWRKFFETKLYKFRFLFFPRRLYRRGKTVPFLSRKSGIPSLIGIHTDRDIITITIFNRIINRRTILYVCNSGNNRRYTSLRAS